MKLAFERHGGGEPVLILHGLFGSHENWGSVARRLAEEFEVFAADLRNHGASPHAPEMDFKVLAADVAEFIGAHIGRPTHVLGHSLGGKTGMEAALSYPAKVRSLVVVDIAPRTYPRRHQPILQGMLDLDPGAYTSRKEMEEVLAPALPDLATRRFVLKNVARGEDGTFRWRMGLREVAAAYGALCQGIAPGRKYPGPVLFLQGEKSDYLAPGDLPEIQSFFPRAEYQVIPRAGHWVQAENLEATVAAVRNFLVEAL